MALQINAPVPVAQPRLAADPPASPATRLLTATACAVAVVITVAVAAIGLSSPIVDRPVLFTIARTVACLGMLAIATFALVRRSSQRLTVLMVASGFAMALAGLTVVDSPVPFMIGRMFVAVALLALVYVVLSYPQGRIDDRASHVFVAVAAAGTAVLLAANVLFTPYPPVAGPFVRCSGSACPTNPLVLIELASGPSRALSTALALWTSVIVGATAVLVARRGRSASRLQRRSLGPVFAWTVLMALGYAGFIAVRATAPQSSLLTPAAVVVAWVIALWPFAVAFGIARGRVFAVSGLERMLAGIGDRPDAGALQRAMARAFGDPTLRLAFCLPSTGRYADIEGRPVELPNEPTRTVTRFGRNGRAVAAVIHDPALAEQRPVLDAAGSALLLALEKARLEADLRASAAEVDASRRRIVVAADHERQRIERDLHDGAQQRLVALRIRLSLLQERASDDPESVADGLERAGEEINATIEEIRNLARGIYPHVLSENGVPDALASVARRLPFEVVVEGDFGRRFAPEVESAVYFCCVEAIQNVAKHGGMRPRARVRLRYGSDGDLRFEVTDDGPGFEPEAAEDGHGIAGMGDRIVAIGGELTIDSSLGAGTLVSGRVPAAALRELDEDEFTRSG